LGVIVVPFTEIDESLSAQ
jgi:hypothetical protein